MADSEHQGERRGSLARGVGIGLVLLAIGLGIAAVAGLTRLGPTTTGAVEVIEQGLGDPTVTSAGTVVTTTLAAPEQAAPLWEPNERGALGDIPPPAAEPARLRIPAISLDAPVSGYGVDERTGQMDIPANASEVAWYRFGPRPGEAGSAVLAAHVDLESQGPGVFFELGEVAPGDEVVVGYDDGTARRFRVAARAVYPKESLPLEAIFSREGTPVLTLITCGGGFNAAARSYDSNVVVYAVPVDPPGPEPGLAPG